MLLRGANAVGYTTYADNVVTAFVAESKCARPPRLLLNRVTLAC